jgi:hypothetical protein
MARPEKITFADMRDMGVRGLLIYCSDYKCSHLVTMSSDRWPDGMRLSDIERRFVCSACDKRGADVRRSDCRTCSRCPKHQWPRQYCWQTKLP